MCTACGLSALRNSLLSAWPRSLNISPVSWKCIHFSSVSRSSPSSCPPLLRWVTILSGVLHVSYSPLQGLLVISPGNASMKWKTGTSSTCLLQMNQRRGIFRIVKIAQSLQKTHRYWEQWFHRKQQRCSLQYYNCREATL